MTPDAAAEALVATLEDPQSLRESGRRARARAEREFTLEAANRRWLEAAGPAVAGRPGSRPGPGAALTLVTVTHNSSAELERLLDSVERGLPGASVVVVDSGSSDGSADAARRRAGRVRVVELDNVGYGRATNAGLALVETAVAVIVNPDVELVDGSLGGAGRRGAARRRARAPAGAAGAPPRRPTPGLRPP